MTQSNKDRDAVALALSCAYWRGRLDGVKTSVQEDGAINAAIEAAGNHDIDYWKSSALNLISRLGGWE